MTFILATNTGKGFYTVADRQKFTFSNVALGLYEVSGDYQSWVDRVGGTVTTDVAAADMIATQKADGVANALATDPRLSELARRIEAVAGALIKKGTISRVEIDAGADSL